MKSAIKIFTWVVLAFFFSCSDHDKELGGKLDPSELNFTIVQDYSIDEGGNTVILSNRTPGTVPVWDYGTGKSNKAVDTIRYAFEGEYTIKFSAVTGGGVVDAEPVTISVTANNLNYVSDPMWTYLSGGVGERKSWILDNGEYGMAPGALAYGDPSTVIEYNNFTPNWEPAGIPPSSTEEDMHWGNYMTFSLDGGPFMTVHDGSDNKLQEGTYFLDKDAKTLSTTDATILRPDNYIANASNWNDNLKILTLDDNQLRIAVLRTNDEGEWWYIWNYVSKDYADNYVPVETEPVYDEGFDPTFAPGELLQMLTGGYGAGRMWVLDANGNPVDWIANGVGWTESGSSSYSWGWDDDWGDVAGNSWVRFDQYGGTQNYTRNQDGTESSGSFTIQENSDSGMMEIVLSGDTLIQNPGHWMNPSTNTITVVKGFNNSFQTNGIWFGTEYNPESKEWLAYHYIIGAPVPSLSPREQIVKALTNGNSRTFKVSNTWPIDWLDADLTGGWTLEDTFGNDYESNSWVWTKAVQEGLEDPTLTFSTEDGINVTATKVQDGETTTAEVIINAADGTLEIAMDLIAFTDAANWLPTYGPVWYICKVPVTSIVDNGLWLGHLNEDQTEVLAVHYVISE